MNRHAATILLSLSAMLPPISAAHAQSPAGAPLIADAGFARTPLATCETDLQYLNAISGWQTAWPAQWAQIARTGAPSQNDLDQWKHAPSALNDLTETLAGSIGGPRAAPQAATIRVLDQIDQLTDDLWTSSSKFLIAEPETDAALTWNAFVKSELAPALSAFERFLRDEYLPGASDAAGLAAIDDGAACFSKAVAWWTTLEMTGEEITTTGNRLLAQTQAELVATGDEGQSLNDILDHLRNQQNNDATTAAELIAISEAALARASGEMHRAFAQTPSTPVIVEEMPLHMQASFPAGFYRPGDESAAYVINPSRPGERRLMAEVIAFHEGLPGHHLFFAYPREGDARDFNAGLAEGWAIYAEYLADELGLYGTDYDRQGMIAKHLWAASRLVIEPGLHLHGWTREEAIDFMLSNTAMQRAEVEIEIDRYIAMPGQSLSYMLGADLLLTERALAETALGDAFDIKAFHSVVLDADLRPLPVVRTDIRDWVASMTVNQ